MKRCSIIGNKSKLQSVVVISDNCHVFFGNLLPHLGPCIESQVFIHHIQKKVPVYFLPLALPNVDQFSKFFHRRT